MRPTTATASTAADIEDWYWTRAELDTIARRVRVPRTGSKGELTQRLIAHFAGKPLPVAKPKRGGQQLRPPFAVSDVVPQGQRMTQELRAFFIHEVGKGFRFDARLRAFFADPAGRTLGDAIELWRQPRTRTEAIPGQFEYNRFTRAYRAAHPAASTAQLLAAWEEYKRTPISQRTKGAPQG